VRFTRASKRTLKLKDSTREPKPREKRGVGKKKARNNVRRTTPDKGYVFECIQRSEKGKLQSDWGKKLRGGGKGGDGVGEVFWRSTQRGTKPMKGFLRKCKRKRGSLGGRGGKG